MGGMESYRSFLDPNSLLVFSVTLPKISHLLASAIKGWFYSLTTSLNATGIEITGCDGAVNLLETVDRL